MTDVPILKGCLKKKSPKGISGMRAWQKRFFFLFDGRLAYAKQDDIAKISGVIPLAEVTSIETIPDKPTRLRIEVTTRIFDLDAGSVEEADNWVAALNRCWIAAKEIHAGSPTLSPQTTANGKFWKATASGAMPSGGSSGDNLTAPSISAGLNSKAFTPIRVSNVLNNSGYFGTVGRTSNNNNTSPLKSRISNSTNADTLFVDNDSNSQSIHEYSSHQSDFGTSPQTSPKVANLIRNAMKRSQSINKSLTLFNNDSPDSNEFGYADFERGDKVADCCIGSLHRAILKQTGDSFLLQVVMKRDDHFEKGDTLIKLMNKPDLHHPFFARLMFSGHTPDRSWAAYTFVARNSTIFDRLRAVKRLPEQQACSYLAEIVLFTAFLHHSGRLFKNMKPEYIGLDAMDHIMVLDLEAIAFSSVKSAESDQLPMGEKFDEFWTPELISGHGESVLSDWWRLGSLLYELLVGFPPFRAKTRDELLSKVREGSVRFPPFVSEHAQDFIKRCLIHDPNHRLGVDITDTLNHGFFQSINWTSLHWNGLTRTIPDAGPDAPIRLKVRVKEGSEFPEGLIEPAIRLSYGNSSWSTLSDVSGTNTPAWNTKFEFDHDAVAAANNAMLKIELCIGHVSMAFANEPVDLAFHGCQKRKVQLCNGDGVQMGFVTIDIKVKYTVSKHAEESSASSSRKILKRSITSSSVKGVGRARRPSVLLAPKLHRRASILQDVSGKLSGKLRSLVSKNKHRFQVDGFDLDLTYLTSQMIVMGFPSSNLEGVYRNPMEEVQRFVKTYHDGHCRVINLCSERSYDPACFDNNVASFPFDDHNPPPLKTIVDFCRDVKAYLDAHPENVVATHCKAGKGRTGVMAASFLLFSGSKPTAADALEFFGDQRTADGKGVTIPSQIRAVYTFEKYLQQTANDTKPFQFDGIYHNIVLIRLSPEPDLSPLGGCDPFCRIYRNRNLIYDSLLSKVNVTRPGKNIVDIPVDCVVNGDIKVTVYHKTATGKKLMFSFWINMDFIDNNHAILDKNGLDKADKNHKFDAGFRVEMFLRPAEQPKLELIDDFEDKNSIEETTDDESIPSTSEMGRHQRSASDGVDLSTRLKKRTPPTINPHLPDLQEDQQNNEDDDKDDQASAFSSTSNHTDSLQRRDASSIAGDLIEEQEEEVEMQQAVIREEPDESSKVSISDY